MSDPYDRHITIHVRVHWRTPEDQFNDAESDEVFEAIKTRIEQCLATSVCGQVGVVPGTAQMELLYGVLI
jgi:hypothetical protein